MRPQQQNRRMRGRGGSNNNNNNSNNNNRKGPNPLTRSYESNGPDVKIRGSAQQIAEKYTTLARDAQSAGDRVIAENYLQHAEHYNRIIAAAQAQMPQQQQRDSRDDDEEEDGVDGDGGNSSQPQHNNHQNSQNTRQAEMNGHGPQPVIEGIPAEVAYQENVSRPDQGGRDRGEVNGHSQDGGSSTDGESDGDEQQDAAPRRARRPRRPRNRDANPAEAGGSSDQPVPEPVTQD